MKYAMMSTTNALKMGKEAFTWPASLGGPFCIICNPMMDDKEVQTGFTNDFPGGENLLDVLDREYERITGKSANDR